MTDQNTVEEKEEVKPETPRRSGSGFSIFLSLLALLISLAVGAYGYFEFQRAYSGLKTQIHTGQKEAVNTQQSIVDLQQAIQKSQALSAQQEQIMSEWRAAQKGDVDQWRVAEAQYLVKLADDHLQLSQNLPMTIKLLEQADKTLSSLQDPNILAIRKSLTTDIASLQALPHVDITSTYLRLAALSGQVDKLPLPISPLTAAQESTTETIPADLPWWKAGLAYTWQGLSKVVIIRKSTNDALPLVMPDEKIFLFQNLHAQLENAMLALLQQNAEIYQASLTRAIQWAQQYFAQDAQETKNMLQGLEEARSIDIKPTSINLANTLQLFDEYSARVKGGA